MRPSFECAKINCFSVQVSISMRMPKFQRFDHSDRCQWMAEPYASNHTSNEVFSPLEVNIYFAESKKPPLSL